MSERDILYHIEKIEKMLFMLLNEEQQKQINEENIRHLKEQLEIKKNEINEISVMNSLRINKDSDKK